MKRLRRRISFNSALVLILLLPVFVNPFDVYPYEPSKVILFRVIVILMLVFATPSLISFVRQNPGLSLTKISNYRKISSIWNDHTLVLPALVYALVYILATLFSVDRNVSLWGLGDRQGMATMLSIVVFFLLLSAILNSWKQMESLVNALIIGSIAVSLYGWVQLLGLDWLHWQYDPDRVIFVHSTFASHIYLGSYLAMVIPFTLTRLLSERYPERVQKLRYSAILFLQLSCLFLSLARSAILSLYIGLLPFIWFLSGQRLTRRFLSTLLILSGMLVIVYFSAERGILGLYRKVAFFPTSIDFPAIRNASNQSRIITWKRSLEIIPNRWLLGYGPETFPIVNAQVEPLGENDPTVPSLLYDPHNIFLYHLTAVGVFGLAAFLWLVLGFYRIAYAAFLHTGNAHNRLVVSGIISAATVYLAQAQVNPDSIILLMMFWLMLTLGVATSSSALSAG
jgi:hypothetical protein